MKQIAHISGLIICGHGVAMLHLLERHVDFTVALSNCIVLAKVIQKVDNALHHINHYPADIAWITIYPVDNVIHQLEPSELLGNLAVETGRGLFCH